MSHGHLTLPRPLAPRSRFYQGPFGRICPDLPPWTLDRQPHEIDAFLLEFANRRMLEAPGKTPGDIVADPTLRDDLAARFDSKIPAGYTYFGQFIDHDITFDPTSLLMRRNDPNALLNFRTPRLDLDNIYGRGPADQPYLYDRECPGKLLIGRVRRASTDDEEPDIKSELCDLPRNGQGVALIGDPRNDENAIVAQLQLAFLLAHNELVDRASRRKDSDPFESARQTLRWLYQWIVWKDFLARITVDEVHACALRLEATCGGRRRWTCGLEDIYAWKHQPFMPVEFSVAAYRFGHSLVRNSYQTNQPFRGFGVHVPIFDNVPGSNDDLRGFRPLHRGNVVQWDWFLDMASPDPFPQPARRIDTRLSNALAFLREGPSGDPLNVLAYRNLRRGLAFDLPAGTRVAEKFCVKPVDPGDDGLDALWFYILREAETLPGANAGQMLGRVGSLILCATFAGLLKGDPASFVNVQPCWNPDADGLLRPGTDNRDSADGDWTLAAIIRLAGLPVRGADVERQDTGARS